MIHLRAAMLYTLLLFGVTFVGGMVLGIVRFLAGFEHQWGALDATAAMRAALTFVAALGVFAALVRKHPSDYYPIGSLVVFFTAILGTTSAYFMASASDARG